MRLNELRPADGSRPSAKRRGRGIGSGLGKTGGHGVKGQTSRSGGSIKPGFEGGQMPIQRRTPKRGFKNPHRVSYKVFNLAQIEQIIEKYGIQEFTVDTLYVNGLINRTDKVKILGNGEIATKISFKVNAVSEKAKAAIEAAGGAVEIL